MKECTAGRTPARLGDRSVVGAGTAAPTSLGATRMSFPPRAVPALYKMKARMSLKTLSQLANKVPPIVLDAALATFLGVAGAAQVASQRTPFNIEARRLRPPPGFPGGPGGPGGPPPGGPLGDGLGQG